MKVLLSFSLVVMMTTKIFSQDPTPANCQFASVVTVDGQGDEWPMQWLEDPDKKFKYNICTDDNNIYIRMMAKDELVRRKIALFGLTVWMDPNGKKKKRLGLHFPTGTESKERVDQMEKSGEDKFRPNMTTQQRREFQNEINRKMIADIEVLELLGLADEPITTTKTGINNGLKVAIGSDSTGAYVYEAIIPFKAYRLSKANIEELNIGFETGKFVPPPPKANSNNVAQGGPGQGGYGGGMGGNGRMGGGGMGGGRGNFGGGRSYSAGPMASSSSIWVPIQLK